MIGGSYGPKRGTSAQSAGPASRMHVISKCIMWCDKTFGNTMHSLWSLHLSCSELWLHTPWWSEWPFIYDILDKGFKAFIYEYTTRATVFCERCCSVGCTDTPLQKCQCREIALATSLDNSVHRVVGQDARGLDAVSAGWQPDYGQWVHAAKNVNPIVSI